MRPTLESPCVSNDDVAVGAVVNFTPVCLGTSCVEVGCSSDDVFVDVSLLAAIECCERHWVVGTVIDEVKSVVGAVDE